MATHPTTAAESEANPLIKVRQADAKEMAVIERYEALRAQVDSDERRAAADDLERLCRFRGAIASESHVYSYDRHAGELYRHRKATAARPVRYGNKPDCVPRASAVVQNGGRPHHRGG